MISIALGLAPLDDLDTITDITDLCCAADGRFGLDETGRGSFTVPYGVTLPSDPMGQVVWVAFEGELFAGWLVEARQPVELAVGEEAQMVTEYSGRGLAAVLDRYRVQPTLGVGRSPWSRTRAFSVFSPEYDFSGWGAATEYELATDLVNIFSGEPERPEGFPAFDVWWIGPSEGDIAEAPYGYWWAQTTFTLVEDSWVQFFYTADDDVDLYVDGFRFGTLTGGGRRVRSTDTERVYLSAGTHRVGAKVVNNFGDPSLDPGYGEGTTDLGNPTMLLLAGYLSDRDGRLTDRVCGTDDSWKVLSYPDDPPGLTDAEVLDVMVAEALALGVAPEVTLSPAAFDPCETITVRVGDSVLKHLLDRVDAGALHLEYGHHLTFFIDAADFPGSDPSGVTYSTANGNLLAVEVAALDVGTDCLLVAWQGPPILVPPEGGERMGYLETAAVTVGEAKALAEAVLAKPTQPERVQADIAPVDIDDIPGWNAYLGSTVTVGSHTDLILWAWNFDWSDAQSGEPRFGIELGDKIKEREAAIESMISRAAGGQMGGTAPSQPVQDPPPSTARVNASEVTFQALKDGDGNYVLDVSDAKRTSASANLYAVAITCTTPGSTDTEFDFLMDGVDVLSGAGVLPDGERRAEIWVGEPFAWAVAGATDLQVQLTSIGTGVDGIIIEPLFVVS